MNYYFVMTLAIIPEPWPKLTPLPCTAHTGMWTGSGKMHCRNIGFMQYFFIEEKYVFYVCFIYRTNVRQACIIMICKFLIMCGLRADRNSLFDVHGFDEYKHANTNTGTSLKFLPSQIFILVQATWKCNSSDNSLWFVLNSNDHY